MHVSDVNEKLLALHPSHAPAMRRVLTLLGILFAIMAASWLLPAPSEMRGIAGYLPLHTLLETIAIIIASLIFAVGWNTRNRNVAGNVLLLACVFIGVALLDFSHVLSFKGMPDFVTPSDPEKAINFWLAARYLAAFGLLAAALLPWRTYLSEHTRLILLGSILALTTFIYWLFLFHPDVLPRTFISGQGLTPFKVGAEYLLISINIATAVILWLNMRKPQQYHAAALFGTVCVMGMSEFFFTLYANVTDIFNMLGHLYKVAAYLFLYRALFIETIDNPYNNLKSVQKNLELSIHASGIGLWDWNIKTNEIYLSPEWKAQLGYADDELPNSFESWESRLHPDDREASLKNLQNFMAGPESSYQNEFRLRHRTGSYRWIIVRGEKQLNDKGEVVHLRGSHIDITSRKLAENEIHHLAYYDTLTHLPNRRLLLERINEALSESDRTKMYGAILFLDLDKFKYINDTSGHSKGDLLLVETAHRILGSVRKGDMVARLGGDEFIVLVENIGADIATASRVAAGVAEKIRLAIASSFEIEGQSQHSTVSIGISLFFGNNQTGEDIVKHADAAMYQAKNSGRNTIKFFDPSMQQKLEALALLEIDLRNAIDQEQLRLYYQIQVDSDNNPVGAEALIRWQHPVRGMVPPLEFIPLAEESSLILEIGHWVMVTACKQLIEWQKHEHTRDLRLAINVSPVQFHQEDFVERVHTILQHHPINPSLLKIELTESTVLNDVEDVIHKMQALRKLGIRLSMDDFGTGYSSLSYLTQLPLNQIKIDQSFVRDMLHDRNDSLMVQTIIQMANNFSLDVIAEGVETQAQREFLKQNGCMSYQGYLFSKPLEADAFSLLLQQRPWANKQIIAS